jgi:hypothetical protein
MPIPLQEKDKVREIKSTLVDVPVFWNFMGIDGTIQDLMLLLG